MMTARGKPKKSLSSFREMPLDVAFEIFSHLTLPDLLALSLASRSTREVVLMDAVKPVWKAARLLMGFPDLLCDDMSELQYASLVFGNTCMSCRKKTSAAEWALRVRYCAVCKKKEVVRDYQPKTQWDKVSKSTAATTVMYRKDQPFKLHASGLTLRCTVASLLDPSYDVLMEYAMGYWNNPKPSRGHIYTTDWTKNPAMVAFVAECDAYQAKRHADAKTIQRALEDWADRKREAKHDKANAAYHAKAATQLGFQQELERRLLDAGWQASDFLLPGWTYQPLYLGINHKTFTGAPTLKSLDEWVVKARAAKNLPDQVEPRQAQVYEKFVAVVAQQGTDLTTDAFGDFDVLYPPRNVFLNLPTVSFLWDSDLNVPFEHAWADAEPAILHDVRALGDFVLTRLAEALVACRAAAAPLLANDDGPPTTLLPLPSLSSPPTRDEVLRLIGSPHALFLCGKCHAVCTVVQLADHMAGLGGQRGHCGTKYLSKTYGYSDSAKDYYSSWLRVGSVGSHYDRDVEIAPWMVVLLHHLGPVLGEADTLWEPYHAYYSGIYCKAELTSFECHGCVPRSELDANGDLFRPCQWKSKLLVESELIDHIRTHHAPANATDPWAPPRISLSTKRPGSKPN
ncbi:hypothetical protein RQP46_000627 [Phenoliferia psychrophenolica]